MKLGIFSDLHFHNWRYLSEEVGEERRNSRLLLTVERTKEMANVFAKEGVDYVLCCGDIFHRPVVEADVFNLAYDAFLELSKSVKRIFVIPGQHDLKRKLGKKNDIVFLKLSQIDNVVVLNDSFYENEEERVLIYGLGWRPNLQGIEVAISNFKEFCESKKDFYRIGMLHQILVNSTSGKHIFSEGVPFDIVDGAFDWLFVGDIHRPQELGSRILVPGALIRHDRSDTNEDRGFWVVDTVTNVKTFYKTESLSFESLAPRVIPGAVVGEVETKPELDIGTKQESFSKFIDTKGYSGLDKNRLFSLGLELADTEEWSYGESAAITVNFMGVHIKNFLSFSDSTLVLDRNGVWLVLGVYGDGSNGAGKTNLFDAPYWALFGKTTKGLTGDDIIRRGAKKCEVSVKFKCSKGIYLLKRVRTKGITDLEIRSLPDKLICSGVRECEEWLSLVLKLDDSKFRNIVYYSQENLEFLTVSSEVSKKQIIADMFMLPDFEVSIGRLDRERKVLQDKQIVYQQDFYKATGEIEQLEKELCRNEELSKTFEENREKDLKACEGSLTELSEKLKPLLSFNEEGKVQLEREYKTESENLYKVIEVETKLREELSSILFNVSMLATEQKSIEGLEIKVATLFKELEELSGFSEEKKVQLEIDYRTERESYDRIKESEKDAHVELSGITSSVNALLAERRKLESKREGLRKLSVGATCPVCGSIICEESVDKCVDVIEIDIKEIFIKVGELDSRRLLIASEVEEFSIEGEKLRISLLSFEKKLREFTDGVIKLKGAEESIKNIQARILELKKLDDRIKELEDRKTVIVVSMNGHSTEEERLKTSLSLFEKELKSFTDGLIQKKGIEENIKNIQVRIGEVKEAKNEFLRGCEKVKVILEDKKTELASLNELFSIIKDKLLYLDWWKDGFGYRGIRHWLSSQIVSLLTKELQNWRYLWKDVDIAVRDYAELKTGGTREAIDFVFIENGQEFSYKALSGGQKRRADLIVMFALISLGEKLFGKLCNILLLDEVFGGLDVVGEELLVDMLEKLSEERTVYVISHSDSLQGYIPEVVFVKRDEKGSQVVE